MVNFRLITIFLVFLWAAALYTHEAKVVDDVPFKSTYKLMYGGDRLTFLDQGNLLQIIINDTYGDEGAEINSKQKFGSGFFGLKIQLPKHDSRGVDTLFYLTSVSVPSALYFEFDGGNGSKPYSVKTHVYVSIDNNSRTQEMNLWFDPTADLHAYKILWNQHQIVFYVDDTPIRVFKNMSKAGVKYPSESMHIVANTAANDFYWLPPVNWTAGPFIAYYRGFSIDGCPINHNDIHSSSNLQHCYSGNYYWNRRQYWQLSLEDETKMKDKRNKYLVYDYCKDDKKGQFPECHQS